MTPILLEVSPGELIDQITIAEIKAKRLSGRKQELAAARLDRLRKAAKDFFEAEGKPPRFAYHLACLKAANECIWAAEDAVRESEGDGQAAAAMVSHDMNERRFVHKRAIDELFDSEILEVKSYR